MIMKNRNSACRMLAHIWKGMVYYLTLPFPTGAFKPYRSWNVKEPETDNGFALWWCGREVRGRCDM